ncbi:MAG: BNR-4 repeat-containing protein [Planctomycetota bacterium]|nr:BNR-4 repeat-containing protein [Planctomycetota bacterium]
MPESKLRVSSDHILSTEGSTRGTAYSMSNKIVTLGRTVFASWLDSGGKCMVCSLDLDSGELSEPFELGQTAVQDNHCGPAIVATSDGHLHAVLGSHNRPFRYRRPLQPADISQWTDEPPFAPDATYPSLAVGPDDTLHLVSRAWSPPGRSESCKLIYQTRSGDSGWSDPLMVARTPSPTGYVHYGANILCGRDGVLYLTFHMYHGEPAESPIQGFLMSSDGGRSWKHSDGRAVALPATIDTCEILIENDGEVFRGGQSSALDAKGRLNVLVTSKSGTDLILRLESPGTWSRIDLGPEIDRTLPGWRSEQEGNIAFDRHGTLYCCLDVKESSASWGDPSTEVLLLTSSDAGETFKSKRLTTPNTEAPQWLANMERSTGLAPIEGPPAVLYTVGHKGVGCTPKDKTEIHLVILERG